MTEENHKAFAIVQKLKLEAQGHAQEARTANSTIAEIYQHVTEHSGEPGNWNGAVPVAAELRRLRSALDWIIANPDAHPANILAIAKEGRRAQQGEA
jgi:hypothetical protein